jgi:poly-gamma-glutamate synthesis protein (capsule biosynthesis protein)
LKNSPLTILIAGDVVPTPANEQLFATGDIEALVGAEILELFEQSDISTINLECPITTHEHRIEKQGPNLKASPQSIEGIRKLNPTLIGLANNHILDYGEEGLSDTRRILEKFQFSYVGVGDNLEAAASSIQVVVLKEKRIGFYACAEHEFSIATDTTAGANPFDPLTTGDTILKLKSDHALDKLVVLFHGGKEYYQYPSPGLQRMCRHLVEKGADLVVCQHSHCIGAHERYLDGDIVYGQGNFVFDTKNPLSVESLLISYTVDDGGTSSIDFLPIRRHLDGSGTVSLAQGADAESILTAFQKRSEEIEQPGFIEKNYAAFAKKLLPNYLYGFSPFGKWVSRFDRYIFKGRLIKCLYPKRKLLAMQNYIECEAHWELYQEALDHYIHEELL